MSNMCMKRMFPCTLHVHISERYAKKMHFLHSHNHFDYAYAVEYHSLYTMCVYDYVPSILYSIIIEPSMTSISSCSCLFLLWFFVHMWLSIANCIRKMLFSAYLAKRSSHVRRHPIRLMI